MLEEKIIKPISKEKVNSVLVIKILDGHFTDDTWWNFSSTGQEFHHYDLLEAVGGKSTSCLEVNHNGRGWQDFILDSLPQKVRRKVPGSTKYVEVDYEIFDNDRNLRKYFRRRKNSSTWYRRDL